MTATPELPVFGPDWRQDALCAQVGGDDWFPGFGDDSRATKAVCARCDVIQECLKYALDNNIRDGIWGGLAYQARRRLLIEARRVAA